MTIRALHFFPFIASTLLLAACGDEPEPPASPQESVQVTEAVMAWYECEECVDGELEAVIQHGDSAVPRLIATERDGTPPEKWEQLRQALEARYDELAAYADEHPQAGLASSRHEFVEMYLEKLDKQYRLRAVLALDAIKARD